MLAKSLCRLITWNISIGTILVIILQIITLTITRAGSLLRKHSLLFVGISVSLCLLLHLHRTACIQYFNCIPHNESSYSKGKFTCVTLESLMRDYECDDKNEGFNGIINSCTLPKCAHFYNKNADEPPAHCSSCHEIYCRNWDGLSGVKTMNLKLKCRFYKLEMRTFCFCNWFK